MKDKFVVCDSSSLISLSNSGLLGTLEWMKKHFGVSFIIPPSAYREMVEVPLSSKGHLFGLSAVRIMGMKNKGVIDVVDYGLSSEMDAVLKHSNKSFFARGKPLKILHPGEAECLAIMLSTGIRHFLIDERTTRLLLEDPLELKGIMEREFRVNVMLNHSSLDWIRSSFPSTKVFRSSELIWACSKSGMFSEYGDLKKMFVENSLYALKYAGCSIRFSEISKMVELWK